MIQIIKNKYPSVFNMMKVALKVWLNDNMLCYYGKKEIVSLESLNPFFMENGLFLSIYPIGNNKFAIRCYSLRPYKILTANVYVSYQKALITGIILLSEELQKRIDNGIDNKKKS